MRTIQVFTSPMPVLLYTADPSVAEEIGAACAELYGCHVKVTRGEELEHEFWGESK